MNDGLTDALLAEMKERLEPSPPCDCDMAAGEECERCAPWQTLCELVGRDRELREEIARLRKGPAIVGGCPFCAGANNRVAEAVERAEGKAREEIERVRDAGVPPDWRDHVRKLRQENAEQRVELRKAAKREADLRQSAKEAALSAGPAPAPKPIEANCPPTCPDCGRLPDRCTCHKPQTQREET